MEKLKELVPYNILIGDYECQDTHLVEVEEEWKEIAGFESHYMASSFGRIYSIKRKVLTPKGFYTTRGGQYLTPAIGSHDYLVVNLIRETHTVHSIILSTFKENPENKATCNHRDGIRLNNKIWNLEWNTHLENNKHSIHVIGKKSMIGVLNGGSSKTVYQYDDHDNLIGTYPSSREAARNLNFGIPQAKGISRAASMQKQYIGFKWSYIKLTNNINNNMKLKLQRPIAFVDLESTGKIPSQDQIIEISICKLQLDGTQKVHTTRIKPSIPISPGATEVHGISDADVANCKTFAEIAPSLFKFIADCDIAGFASNHFDVPMLYFEFLRCGITLDYKSINLLDAGTIFKRMEARTLVAAYRFYCDKDLEEAHSAEADILATYEVFMAQLERYEELPTTVEELALYSNYDKPILDLSGKFTFNETGDVLYNFGAHMGKPVFENIDYLTWMLSKDFAPDTVAICNQLMDEYQQQLKNKQ